ncbi:putative 3' exoribonuclease [Phage f2b1]|nr:putative 3' exoribonuclease [Phage f2b1]
MKLFFDFEFTGLRQDTTPISLGVKAANGRKFYAEFTDYNKSQVDSWIQENVIDNLKFNNGDMPISNLGDYTVVKGTTAQVQFRFLTWLKQFNRAEFWGDCLSYDGVLLNNLLGGALNVPDNVDYIFYDICTLFKLFGIDPDISREAFIDKPIEGAKHNALYDAEVIEACYDKLERNKSTYTANL